LSSARRIVGHFQIGLALLNPRLQSKTKLFRLEAVGSQRALRRKSLETIIMFSEQLSAPRILLVDDEPQPLELRAK
jgi:hypothetical protein